MKRLFLLLAGLVALMGFSRPSAVNAADAPPPGPDRFTSMTVEVTQRQWWLLDWKENTVQCSLWVEHTGLPGDDDVASNCGQELYQKWKSDSPPCTEEDTRLCKGYYWLQVKEKQIQKEIPLALPEVQVWVSLEDCEPDFSGWCTKPPLLVLSAEEPLSGYTVTKISGLAGSDPFFCEGARCVFQLNHTRPEGINLQFWAYSTYGDSSPIFQATLRVISAENDETAILSRWYVDVLSPQWTGAPNATCSQAWQSFPPVSGLPSWLSTPEDFAGLASDVPYAYLAHNLIRQGAVDVEACADGGFLEDGTVSQCGLEASRPAILAWQNRFDSLIFQAAQNSEVPAQLLKNLFSRESQFWPGSAHFSSDVGLGQLTEDGADTTLLWNPSFYKQFCPLVLGEETCAGVGYASLKEKDKALLRGALVRSVDAVCADCPLGIDLERADYSVGVFARTLLASCEQTGRIIQNVTGKPAGQKASYPDLWRFTLVNYNAGPGCLGDALQAAQAAAAGENLTWESVSAHLSPVCSGALPYVESIAPPRE